MLWLLMLVVLLHWPAVARAGDLGQVGALIPFDAAPSLDLADYCNGQDAGDDTACIGQWIAEAQAQGRDLFVSPGHFRFTRSFALYSGFHLRCAHPLRSVFVGTGNTATPFVLAAGSARSPEPWQDVSIEQCGFDVNGSTENFLAVVLIKGETHPARHLTVRGNLFFDTTQPGQMFPQRDRQRQYVLLLNVEDVLIEHNGLSEGGRIKAGRPGKRMVIRYNTLHNINDNGITVVDRGSGTTADVLIEHNTIVNPLGSGVFVGTDGQSVGTAGTTMTDVTVRHNLVLGDFMSGCISGVLPNHTARLYIGDNTCHKTGATGAFAGGIVLTRDNLATLPATQVTVEGNRVQSDVFNALNGLAGIFASSGFTTLCLLDNVLTDTATAIRLDNAMTVKLTGNTLGGGSVRIKGTGVQVDSSGSRAGCLAEPHL